HPRRRDTIAWRTSNKIRDTESSLACVEDTAIGCARASPSEWLCARAEGCQTRLSIGQPGEAELAFMVVDQYQGKGICTALLRHLIAIGRDSGLRETYVLSHNTLMLKVFARNDFRAGAGRERGTKHLTLQL